MRITRLQRALTGVFMLLTLAINGLQPVAAHADTNPSSQFPIDVSVSSLSEPANNTSTVTFELFIYGYSCATTTVAQQSATCPDGTTSKNKVGQSGHSIGIYDSGNGDTLGGTQTSGGTPYVTSDSSGMAEFTLASSVAEAKTLQFTDHVSSSPYSSAPSKTVTFTPLITSTSSSSNAAAAIAAPDPPKLTKLQISGKTVSDLNSVALTSDQSLMLSGTTIPNGSIALAITNGNKQDPQALTAANDGTWTYTIQKPGAGTYTVKATVTDPTTSKVSSSATLVSFISTAAKSHTATAAKKPTVAKKSSKAGLFICVIAVVILLLAGLLVWFFKRRKQPLQLRPVLLKKQNPKRGPKLR